MSSIRVRFAPSPTGFLHIGGVRTALYNWLFARNKKGKFILRIEDTDIDRSRSEFTRIIIEGFKWLNLNIDEGPFYQSERLNLYRDHAFKLLEEEKAYKCYCTPDEIEQRKKEKGIFQYDKYCIDRQGQNKPFALRFRVPEGTTSYTDIVSGNISFKNSQFEDFVILRSNGMPTYNFAVVIDDALMDINYIIRGDDHISNTPKHILLYNALGFNLPHYAHLPMILGGDGKRLSKRFGATSTEEYRKMGILPDALLNYLARLGWSHGDQEIFSVEELINLFDLKDINNSAAVFDIEKLEWVNSQHLKDSSPKDIRKHLIDLYDDHSFFGISEDMQYKIIDLMKARAKYLPDLIENSIFLYKNDFETEKKAFDKFLNKDIIPVLNDFIQYLIEYPSSYIQEQDLGNIFKSLIKKYNIKMIKLAQAVRVSLTGTSKSPGLYEIIDIIGRDQTVMRLQRAINKIKENDNEQN